MSIRKPVDLTLFESKMDELVNQYIEEAAEQKDGWLMSKLEQTALREFAENYLKWFNGTEHSVTVREVRKRVQYLSQVMLRQAEQMVQSRLEDFVIYLGEVDLGEERRVDPTQEHIDQIWEWFEICDMDNNVDDPQEQFRLWLLDVFGGKISSMEVPANRDGSDEDTLQGIRETITDVNPNAKTFYNPYHGEFGNSGDYVGVLVWLPE